MSVDMLDDYNDKSGTKCYHDPFRGYTYFVPITERAQSCLNTSAHVIYYVQHTLDSLFDEDAFDTRLDAWKWLGKCVTTISSSIAWLSLLYESFSSSLYN